MRMQRKNPVFAISVLCLLFPFSLQSKAETVCEGSPLEADCSLIGSSRSLPDGSVLLVGGTEEEKAGALVFNQPFRSDDLSGLRVTIGLSIKPGDRGLGEGFALGVLETSDLLTLGTPQGLFGIGDIPGCKQALLVEVDTLSNDPGDFRPMGEGIPHVGIDYLREGSVSDLAYIPSLAKRDLSAFFDKEQGLKITLRASFIGNRITVECMSQQQTEPVLLSYELEDPIPFQEAILVASASNGLTSADFEVDYVKVEKAVPPPPSFMVRSEENSFEISLEGKVELYREVALSLDNQTLGYFSPDEKILLDTPPGEGVHLITLVAYDHNDQETPPAWTYAYTGKPFLLVDAGTDGQQPSSFASAWAQLFEESGLSYLRVTKLEKQNLSEFQSVLWIAGSGRRQRTLSAHEEKLLLDYIDVDNLHGSSARLLLEGADFWTMPGGEELKEVDGVRAEFDGWPLQQICDTENRTVDYNGLWISPDQLIPAPEELGGEAKVLWKSCNTEEPGGALSVLCSSLDKRICIVNSSVELARIEDPDERISYGQRILDFLTESTPEVLFVRGDVTDDGSVDIADVISTLGYLFAGKALPACPDSADTNDDGRIQISDAIALLGYLFAGGVLPEPSPPACGPDPTEDMLPPCKAVSCR